MSRRPSTSVEPGCVALLAQAETLLGSARVGLLTHPAGVLPDLTYLADRILDHPQVNLTALFGPEHGLVAQAQDQIAVGQSTYRGVPVYSLYGDSEDQLRPRAGMLAQIDILAIDLQDIGARYYTYIYTMAYCLDACAQAGIPVIVCDRPNPLNGLTMEGPLLDRQWASFVGRDALPVRHGMTVGELAWWWREIHGRPIELTILPAEKWRRDLWFDQCGLPWVPPSPNMPTLDTAIVYPGGCLLEGTNISEGRGTTCPFEMIGAPWLDGREVAALMTERDLPGVAFRPISFIPTFHKYAGEVCQGVFVHVTNRQTFQPFRSYLELIAAVRLKYPKTFAWRSEPYEFVTDRLAFDLLCGSDRIRLHLEEGGEVQDLVAAWKPESDDFTERRQGYLNPAYAPNKQ